jgi:hypothetical protein
MRDRQGCRRARRRRGLLWRVSDGDLAVVGDSPEFGEAYVYRFNGTTWVQEAVLVPETAEYLDAFGHRVAVSGETILVAAPDRSLGGFGRGAVFVFERHGGTWRQASVLTASDGSNGDRFGYSLAFDGDIAVMGAPFDSSGVIEIGSAYVFRRVGSMWIQDAKLPSADPHPFAHFGRSVGVSDDVVLVGRAASFTPVPVYVCRRLGAQWILEAELAGSDAGQYADFGWSVDVRGRTIAVGAPGDDGDRGAVYVFGAVPRDRRQRFEAGSGPGPTLKAEPESGWTWIETGKLIASVAGGGQPAFGWSVADPSESSEVPLDDPWMVGRVRIALSADVPGRCRRRLPGWVLRPDACSVEVVLKKGVRWQPSCVRRRKLGRVVRVLLEAASAVAPENVRRRLDGAHISRSLRGHPVKIAGAS